MVPRSYSAGHGERAEDPGDDERVEGQRAHDQVRDVAGVVGDQVPLGGHDPDPGEPVGPAEGGDRGRDGPLDVGRQVDVDVVHLHR